MKVESCVSKDLRVASTKEKYDAQVKTLLANKDILACILKNVVTEFKELEIEYIRDECIENPHIGTVRVNPGQTNSKVSGKTNENVILEEGTVIFDIIFDAYLTDGKGKIKIIINIEAQKNSKPGYEIVTRALYYCSRMISSQYGREFEKSAYDKLDVILIYLTRNYEDESEYIIEVLSTLLTKQLDADAKIRHLENLGIQVSTNLEEGVAGMCNLSEGVYEDGRKKA